ncbi:C4-dicarboxylate ABC transporter permease [Betaproteobacteria bacterium GR16-43]|nr:C4-dicarboxylate ABC transporter permease [Betaproteobacteria bacterium GR16-43]
MTEPDALTDDQRRKVEEFVEEEEGAISRYKGWLATFLTAVAVASSAFHLFIASPWGIVRTDYLRGIHVGIVLFLTFMMFPVARRFRHRLMWFDVVLALVALSTIVYMLLGGDAFADRTTTPTAWDQAMGIALIVLVIEATRRTSGWIMPFVIGLFLAYAFAGPYLPSPWTHRGYDVARLVGHMYMTLEGIFGVAVDVSATLIILFTIYGAFLQYSGAGKFFLDFSFALLGGKTTSSGRAVVLASFLLGGPSGSGVATTVTIGSVAYPMLQRAGYEKNAAGGLLAAGGLGAILSPPVLGAAAFLIAEFLKVSYLEVIKMATIPTVLYYFSLFLMVELDARKYGMSQEVFEKVESAWSLSKRYWFHFLSLVSIVFFMLWGFSPTLSVFWATVTAFVVSFLDRDSAMVPKRVVQAMEAGTTGVLNVAATCASAGLIVGVVTLTGLGLKFSSIVIDYAGGSLALTALYTALIVWIVGLAVPVTASYIICAVITAPALITLGVPDFAAHMFIFYYALLSEVSPPTALSCFAAAAITGGDPYKTTLQAWKYTMPAFVVPFFFVLDPMGSGILLQLPKGGSWAEVAVVVFFCFAAIAALAAGLQGWLLMKTNLLERALLIGGGLLIIVPANYLDDVGLGLAVLALALQYGRRRKMLSTA